MDINLVSFTKKFNAEVAFKKIVSMEGTRYTDDPNDPGGATKFGITLATAKAAYRKGLISLHSEPTKQWLSQMQLSTAADIFHAMFADYDGIDRMSHPFAEAAAHAIWGSGPGYGLAMLYKHLTKAKLFAAGEKFEASPDVLLMYDKLYYIRMLTVFRATSPGHDLTIYHPGWFYGVYAMYTSNLTNHFKFWNTNITNF
jgi:hypothetical protein